jgi:hypothetical protein
MQALAIRRIDPELKQVVREASRALALLDANRLEELACACRALRCDRMDPAELRRQAREAAGEMAVLARVLDATRANIHVMNRLKGLREGRLSYLEIDGGRIGEAADGND